MTITGFPVMHEAEGGVLIFRCPGCGDLHSVQHGIGKGPRWAWNGSLIKPTLTPSIKVTGVRPLTEEQYREAMMGENVEHVPYICHSFITDGLIRFLHDCTHALAGQEVPLQPWGGS